MDDEDVKDAMIDRLLDRLEARALTVRDQRDRVASLADERRARDARHAEEVRELRAQLARARAGRTLAAADVPAQAYDELRQMALDIHALIERADLADAEKVRSILGLVQQAMGRDWFRAPRPPDDAPEPAGDEGDGDAPAAGQPGLSPNPARRTTKRG